MIIIANHFRERKSIFINQVWEGLKTIMSLVSIFQENKVIIYDDMGVNGFKFVLQIIVAKLANANLNHIVVVLTNHFSKMMSFESARLYRHTKIDNKY